MSAWLERASVLLAEPDPGPTPFVVEGLLTDGGIGAIQGSPKVGKTWVVLELATAIVTGRAAFGRFAVPEPGAVMVVLEESGRAALRRRLDKLARGYALASEAFADLHFSANRRVRLNDRAWQERILDAAKELRPKAIFLDPLARMKGALVDENAQRELGPVLDFLRDLRDASGAAVVFVHHAGHDGTRLRGSSDLEAYWESKVTVTRDDEGVCSLVAEHREAEATEPLRYLLAFDAPTETVRLVPLDRASDETAPERDHEAEVRALVADGKWRTATEIAQADRGGIGAKRPAVEAILDRLVATGAALRARGPEGRAKDAICYRGVVPASGRPRTTPPGGDAAGGRPTGEGSLSIERDPPAGRPPLSLRPAEIGQPGVEQETNGAPHIGDSGYLQRLFAVFEEDHITEAEWREAERAHRFVAARARSGA